MRCMCEYRNKGRFNYKSTLSAAGNSLHKEVIDRINDKYRQLVRVNGLVYSQNGMTTEIKEVILYKVLNDTVVDQFKIF